MTVLSLTVIRSIFTYIDSFLYYSPKYSINKVYAVFVNIVHHLHHISVKDYFFFKNILLKSLHAVFNIVSQRPNAHLGVRFETSPVQLLVEVPPAQ